MTHTKDTEAQRLRKEESAAAGLAVAQAYVRGVLADTGSRDTEAQGAVHTPMLHLTAVERARIFRLVLDMPQNEVAAVIEQLVEACKGAEIQLPKGLAGKRCTAAIAAATGAQTK